MSEVNSATVSTTTILKVQLKHLMMIGMPIKQVMLLSLITAGYVGYRKLKERRRNHGEYRPQFAEYQHAKNLPYLQYRRTYLISIMYKNYMQTFVVLFL
ncbi:hypothetical protein QQG55_55900 [Brugia pahangi]